MKKNESVPEMINYSFFEKVVFVEVSRVFSFFFLFGECNDDQCIRE